LPTFADRHPRVCRTRAIHKQCSASRRVRLAERCGLRRPRSANVGKTPPHAARSAMIGRCVATERPETGLLRATEEHTPRVGAFTRLRHRDASSSCTASATACDARSLGPTAGEYCTMPRYGAMVMAHPPDRAADRFDTAWRTTRARRTNADRLGAAPPAGRSAPPGPPVRAVQGIASRTALKAVVNRSSSGGTWGAWWR